NYFITVENVNGTCRVMYVNNPVQLTAPNAPTITNVQFTNPTDCGVNDGTITVTATGTGVPAIGIQYSINGGITFQNTGTFTGVTAGSYNIVVQNVGGSCPVTNPTITLVAPALPTIINVTATSPSNCGLSDGVININANSAGSIEYSINGGTTWQPSNIFSGLPGGTYNAIRVRNIDGTCMVTYPTVVLNTPVAPVINNVTFTNPSDCSTDNGTITITATGAVGLEYSIDGGFSWHPSGNFTLLGGGNYQIAVRNIGGSCQVNGQTITLVTPAAPIVTQVQTVNPSNCSASDGSITITAVSGSGSYQYSKDGGVNWQPSNTFAGLASGNYDIRVRNADGSCEVTNPVVILAGPQQPTITNVSATNPTDCGINDGTITINAQGAMGLRFRLLVNGVPSPQHDWQQTNTFFNLSSGIAYTVEVQNANLTCIITGTTVTLTSPSPVTITSVTSTNPTDCGLTDGTITVNATGAGAIRYSINGGVNWQASNVFTGLGTGNFTIVTSNGDGTCEEVYPNNPVILTTPSAAVITNIITNNPTTCGGSDGMIVIVAQGGNGPLRYSINGGTTFQFNNVFTGLTAGTYNVVVKNMNNSCPVTNPPVVLNDGGVSPTDYMTASTPIECVGQTMQYVVRNLTAINYTNATVSPSTGAQVLSVSGDSVIVRFTGIATGQYNYTVSVTNVNGCTFTTNVSYIIKATPDLFAQDLTYCLNNNGTYTLPAANIMVNGTAVPPNHVFQYLSTMGTFGNPGTPGTTFTPTLNTAGNHTIIATSRNTVGCTGRDTFDLILKDTIVINIPVNDTICLGGNVPLTVQGAVMSNWSVVTGDANSLSCAACATTIATPTTTTVYEVMVTSGNSCTSTKQFTITVQNCNDTPIAINDFNNTLINTAVNGQVLTNDFDPNAGDNLTVNTTPITTPSNGNVVLNANGTYTYTPNTGFTGTDTFSYAVCDDGIPGPLCDTAIVVINVFENTPVLNNPPVANIDAYVTNVNVGVNGNLIINDFDPDGDNISVNTTIISGPLNGLALIFNNGTFAYNPNSGFVGQDEFSYVICDDGTPSLCDTATVYITVLPNTNGADNDPPVAVDDANVTNINTTLLVLHY
ncbi:MAG: cadherin-like domain-containing protein, partial [Saprospiraceae bacterium]|nr:cadherin-like domain-containing protein [Saprospiraceae bacterium]